MLRDPEGDGTYTNEQGLFAESGTLDEIEAAVQTALAEMESGECQSDIFPRNWEDAGGGDGVDAGPGDTSIPDAG